MTLREILTARLERAKGKKARALTEAAASQDEIDACLAALKSLTPAQDTWLATMCDLGVLKTQD